MKSHDIGTDILSKCESQVNFTAIRKPRDEAKKICLNRSKMNDSEFLRFMTEKIKDSAGRAFLTRHRGFLVDIHPNHPALQRSFPRACEEETQDGTHAFTSLNIASSLTVFPLHLTPVATLLRA